MSALMKEDLRALAWMLSLTIVAVAVLIFAFQALVGCASYSPLRAARTVEVGVGQTWGAETSGRSFVSDGTGKAGTQWETDLDTTAAWVSVQPFAGYEDTSSAAEHARRMDQISYALAERVAEQVATGAQEPSAVTPAGEASLVGTGEIVSAVAGILVALVGVWQRQRVVDLAGKAWRGLTPSEGAA